MSPSGLSGTMAMQSVKVPPRSMEIWIFFEGEEEEAMVL